MPPYYRLPSDKEYLCSTTKDNGLHRCQDLAPLRSIDLTTLCQNTLPQDWRPPVSFGPDGQQTRAEDRFIDGERVPFDLVPGDESSPFLVKQMSPLIAQSVFQPAFAPRQLGWLRPMRQRRHAKRPISQPEGAPAGRAGHGLGLRANKSRRQLERPLARLVRLAPAAANRRQRQRAQTESQPSQALDRAQELAQDPLVETNANSDQFEQTSQSELTKSDKSSRRYYLRKKASKGACINWNKYYTECKAGDSNPFQGTISFDNVGMAWTAIFLVISLEGWSDIMYLLQDSHSFWVWIYFVLLIVIGSFFMINLCLVVIATQFSATKKREMERMRQERLKFSSSSTLTAASESTNCYTVIVKSIARCLRRARISFVKMLKRRKCDRLARKRNRERKQQLELGAGLANFGPAANSRVETECGWLEDRRGARELDGGRSAASKRTSWKRQSRSAARGLESSGGGQLVACPRPAGGRSIRLDQSECGPACRGLARSASRRSGSSVRLHSNCAHFGESELDVEISFCPTFLTKNERLQHLRLNFNKNIRLLVDHRYFQRLILLAILINAISMGIEYHNQPEQLTEAVEISNIVFACLFLVEMILKLIAHGLYNYVIDGFNCFDGCIVILSILELFESSSGSGLSVLRTFRLLRILKLVRFMPALRRQLLIMLRTLDNVAVFFALLVLFIFIFSILGMNLFGCKFCETLPDGTERCDRKNFNSLLWSLVTVFQILTQEDWNVSLVVAALRLEFEATKQN